VVDRVTRAIDLMPALLDRAGLELHEPLPGRRIFRGEFADHALVEGKEQWALVRGATKLVSTGDVRTLYDLDDDPQETRDVAAAEPALVKSLLDLAESIRVDAPGMRREAPVIDTELDAEAIRDLRQLGYIE
jgi:arylsulfatase A-like enzyme